MSVPPCYYIPGVSLLQSFFFFFTISRTITSGSLSIFVLHEAGELHRTHSGMSPSVATSLSTLLQEAVSQVVPVSGVVEGVGIAVGVAVGVAAGVALGGFIFDDA